MLAEVTKNRAPAWCRNLLVDWEDTSAVIVIFELPIFIESLNDQLGRQLRIIPDKSGPLIFLRSFGSIPFWRKSGSVPIAHPWLVYSELMFLRSA